MTGFLIGAFGAFSVILAMELDKKRNTTILTTRQVLKQNLKDAVKVLKNTFT
jgi:hypothetical protein